MSERVVSVKWSVVSTTSQQQLSGSEISQETAAHVGPISLSLSLSTATHARTPHAISL